MTQNDPTDTDLMAYADGALPPAEAARIAALAARDAAVAQRLQRFTATRDALQGLRRDDAARVDLPPALAARLRATLDARAAPAADAPAKAPPPPVAPATVVPLRRRPARMMPLWSGALAASLALAVGLGGGLWLSGQTAGQTAADPLSAALDTAPSGTTVPLAGGEAVTPVASFRAEDGALCREYDLQAASGTGRIGVACATPAGWDTRLLIATGATAAGYAPAAAPELLDSFYRQTGAGQPLPAADEAAALQARRAGR